MFGSSGITQVTDASAHKPALTHVPFGTLAQTAPKLSITSSAQGNAGETGFTISEVLDKPADLEFSATSNGNACPIAPLKPRKRTGRPVKLTAENVKTEFAEMVKTWNNPGFNVPMSQIRDVIFAFFFKMNQLSKSEKRKIGEFGAVELGLILINVTFQNEGLQGLVSAMDTTENDMKTATPQIVDPKTNTIDQILEPPMDDELKTNLQNRLEELEKELSIQKMMLEEKDKMIEELQENNISITKKLREEGQMIRKLQSGIDVFVELGSMHARDQEEMKSSHQREIEEKVLEIIDLDAKLVEERGAFLQITKRLEEEKMLQANKLVDMEERLKGKRETLAKLESFIRNQLACKVENMEEGGSGENQDVTIRQFSGSRPSGRRGLKIRNKDKGSSDIKKTRKI
ncbi:hypothetical protein CRE_06540 [Caenorhabditis remanei]|uniref:Uncharacterized protein n=1 Tax=Caenorhabditis remanei TaxID=31234 RepID=E3M1G4_CAERE|nr:hypothetical protein CRE_06540 [Caenorhabditis remanei]